MTALPSSLALASIADGSSIIASDHRTNYSSIQTFANALVSILGGGSSGQVLQSGGAGAVAWAAPSAGTFYRKNTTKTVNTSVAETDMLNGEITIAAGAMGTTGLLRVTPILQCKNATGGSVNFTFRLKLGATTVFDSGAIGFAAVTQTVQPVEFHAIGMNLGAANSQAWQGFLGLNDASNQTAWTTPAGAGDHGGARDDGRWINTSAEDTSVSKLLQLSVQMGTSSGSAEAKLYGALVEVI